MPRPIGWRPSVTTTSRWMPSSPPVNWSSLRRRCASRMCRTLALGPTGMSISRCVEPAAAFFERIDATIWPCESRLSGRSTDIRASSAGARCALPPPAMQPRSLRTLRRIVSSGISTCASTSMVSAAPVGEAIARLEVFGISMPCVATIGTTSSEVRLPGIPPMQCLSATSGSRQWRRSPDSIIARVSLSTSSRSISVCPVATTNAEISVLERRLSVMLRMTPRKSSSRSPRRLRRIESIDAGGSAWRTMTGRPSRAASCANAGSDSPSSLRGDDARVVDHVQHRVDASLAVFELDLGQSPWKPSVWYAAHAAQAQRARSGYRHAFHGWRVGRSLQPISCAAGGANAPGRGSPFNSSGGAKCAPPLSG